MANAFPNRPVRRDEKVDRREERPKPTRGRVPEGEGGLIKRPAGAADGRSRLGSVATDDEARRATPFQSGKGKPMEKDGKEQGGRGEPTRARTTNVWMAPGAGAAGKKVRGGNVPRFRKGGGSGAMDDAPTSTRAKASASGSPAKGAASRAKAKASRSARLARANASRRVVVAASRARGEGKRFGFRRGGPRGPRRGDAPSGQRPSSPSGRGGGKKGGPGADRRR